MDCSRRALEGAQGRIAAHSQQLRVVEVQHMKAQQELSCLLAAKGGAAMAGTGAVAAGGGSALLEDRATAESGAGTKEEGEFHRVCMCN